MTTTRWGILTNTFSNQSYPIKVQAPRVNLEFEVIMAENHQWLAEITTNPVEEGREITDHIQRQPDQLSLTGIISNSPMTNLLSSLQHDRESPVKQAFETLFRLMEDRQLLTIYTKYHQYPNMILTRLSIPRKPEDGNSIEFTADFTQIRVVSTQLIDSAQAGIYPESTDSPTTQQKTVDTKNRGQIQLIHYKNN